MDFIPHYYGPFSPQITSIIEYLVSTDLIEERAALTNNRRTFYSYLLTQEGKDYADSIVRRKEQYFDEIRKIVGIVENVEENRIDIIFTAAKIYYILNKNKKIRDRETLFQRAQSLKWKLNSDILPRSIQLLKQIYAHK